MIKRSLLILATVAFLTACSSGVKLNDIPVEDKNASASTSSTDPNAAASPVSSAAQSSVATVVGGKTGSQGVAPAGVNVVYFDYDSFTLLPEARAVLERNAAHLQALKNFDTTAELNRIESRTLVICGDDDWILPLDPCSLSLAAGIPGANLAVFPACGHFPFIEQPAEFLRIVRKWLHG